MKPSSSIAAAAAVLFAGCLLMLSGFGWLFMGVVSGHFRLGIPFPRFFRPLGLFVVVSSCLLQPAGPRRRSWNSAIAPVGQKGDDCAVHGSRHRLHTPGSITAFGSFSAAKTG